MIIHLFNSSSVSGPERLVLPALARTASDWMIVNLVEARKRNGEDPLKPYALELGLAYHSLIVHSRWDRAAIAGLKSLLKELKPDAVHAHDAKASIYLLAGLSGERPFPIVSTHHGIHGRPDFKTRLYEWIYRRRYLKSFDRVLCVSTPDFTEMASSKVLRTKTRLHRNGLAGVFVSDEDRATLRKTIRAAWLPNENIPENSFLFGMVGRLSAEKNHSRLLNVLAKLSELTKDQTWLCLVFGQGALEPILKRESERLGLSNRVRWMGYRSTIGREAAGFDLLLSFSTAEGLPINLLEAGWAGIPVAATAVGGVNDLLLDDRYGVRIAPDESVSDTARTLAQFFSVEGRQTLRAQARQFQTWVSTEFTEESWRSRLAAIYQELGVHLCSAMPRTNESLA